MTQTSAAEQRLHACTCETCIAAGWVEAVKAHGKIVDPSPDSNAEPLMTSQQGMVSMARHASDFSLQSSEARSSRLRSACLSCLSFRHLDHGSSYCA